MMMVREEAGSVLIVSSWSLDLYLMVDTVSSLGPDLPDTLVFLVVVSRLVLSPGWAFVAAVAGLD